MNYTKVIIKSEADLPKEYGHYFVKNKGDFGYPNDVFIFDNNNPAIIDDWMNNIDWYLIEDTESCYPKPFVKWFKTQDVFSNIILNGKEVWYIPNIENNIEPEYLSFEQIYYFWLNEIKNK